MNEIGSEFHEMKYGNGKGIHLPDNVVDYAFSFCGRTAIETVLNNEMNFQKALLPSYCCDSMIQPFISAGINIDFYDVYYDDGLIIDLSIDDDVECLLWCNYFGFNIDMPDFHKFIKRGGIVIEDITHSFFSKKQYNDQSHYLIASLRKWSPIISGGYCASLNGELKFKPSFSPPQIFLNKKKNAMISKREYLDGDALVEKEAFLREFSESNKWISDNYSHLMIDDESISFLQSINVDYERKIRRRNATILYEGLKNCCLDFLFKEEEMDCPLFLPVIIKDNKRDLIREKLIENKIYCPIHWPKPDRCESNLYDMELSLICDQRYNEKDMQRIIDILCD